jgi:hypothetical protein
MPAPKKSNTSPKKPTGKPAGNKPYKGKPAGKPTGKPAGKSTAQATAKPAGKKPYKGKPTGKPTGKSTGKMAGPKAFKKRRGPDDFLEIEYTDKELGEMSVIKRKLQEIREYKKILAEDGMKPDQQDKERESELIVRLLRIEKNAKMAARQRAKAAKTEAFKAKAKPAES